MLLLVLIKRCLIGWVEKRCRWRKIDGEKMLVLMMIITWPLVGRWRKRKQSGEVAVVMWHCARSGACVMLMLQICGGGG